MKKNQFVSKIVKQGDRRLIELKGESKEKFESLLGKDLLITVQEI